MVVNIPLIPLSVRPIGAPPPARTNGPRPGSFDASASARHLITALYQRELTVRQSLSHEAIHTSVQERVAADERLIIQIAAEYLIGISEALTLTYRTALRKEPRLPEEEFIGRIADSLIEFARAEERVEGYRGVPTAKEKPAKAVMDLLIRSGDKLEPIAAAHRWNRINVLLAPLEPKLFTEVLPYLFKDVIGTRTRNLVLELLDDENNVARLSDGCYFLGLETGADLAEFIEAEKRVVISGSYPTPLATLIRAGGYGAEIIDAALGGNCATLNEAITRYTVETAEPVCPSLDGERNGAIVTRALIDAGRVDGAAVTATIFQAYVEVFASADHYRSLFVNRLIKFVVGILEQIPGSSEHVQTIIAGMGPMATKEK